MSESKHVALRRGQLRYHRGPNVPTFGETAPPTFDSTRNFSDTRYSFRATTDFSGRIKRRRVEYLYPEVKQRAAKRLRIKQPYVFPVAQPHTVHPALSTALRSSMSYTRTRKKRKRKSTWTTARQALKRVRKLEKKVEIKVFDHGFTTIANVPAAGDIRNMALIAQGDGINQRDGNKISPIGLNIRYHWVGDAASTQDVYRLIIFRDKQQVLGTVPPVLDVLTTATPMSQYNVPFSKRFKILHDQIWTNANDANIVQNFVGVINIRLNLGIRWSDNTAAAVTMNGLYMIVQSNLAANFPNFEFTARVFYYDM